MASFSKQHYKCFAAALARRQCANGHDNLVNESIREFLVDVFSNDNPEFRMSIFMPKSQWDYAPHKRNEKHHA